MKCSNEKCQLCGEVLNENSMFGWVEGFDLIPENIYEKFSDIKNPNELNCCILYCNDCADKWDKVAYKVFKKSISDYHLSRIIQDEYLHNEILENKSKKIFEDYIKIKDILSK